MNIVDDTQLGLERAISGAAMRQSVLASNLANANTPGYKRQDVNFHGALSAAMQTGQPLDGVQFSPQTDTRSLRADGNGVDVDTESASLAKNGLEYESLVSVARARIEILQSAMGSK